MNRLVIAIVCGVLVGMLAPAAASAGSYYSAKRQTASLVNECMKKRMYSDRSISYNEASRACKDQVRKQRDTGAPGPLVAADTSPKR